MGSGNSTEKKVQAVGKFQSYRKTENENKQTENHSEQQSQSKKTEEPKSKRQPTPEPELKPVNPSGSGQRRKRDKPKIEKIEFDDPVSVDFTNCSQEKVYVFILEKGKEKHCVAELGGDANRLVKFPRGCDFTVKDIYDDVYFSSQANSSKICFIPSFSISDKSERSGLRLFNKSSSKAVVKSAAASASEKKSNDGVPGKVYSISAKSDLFLQPKQGCLFQINTERSTRKFEVMSSSSPQHFEINEDFSDMLCLASPYAPYHEASFMGFLLMVEKDLMDKKKHSELYEALKEDFKEMTRVLPRGAIGLMRRVALYINIDSDPCVTGLCFHRDRNWLALNNEPFEKYCAVEIRNQEQYLRMRAQKSPGCLLHEYAHAYYFFTTKTNGALIQYSYEETLERGHYMSLSAKRPHYAITDCEEYFAECSVAFFSSKLFRACKYPHDCFQLRAFDPIGFEMCEKVYNVLGHERQKQYSIETSEQYMKNRTDYDS